MVLEALLVVEVLRGLHQGDERVVEVAEGVAEQVAVGDVVGVQDGDDVGVDVLERVVDVAGLRVAVLLAGEVARAEGPGQLGDLRPVAVVEHPGLVRDVDRHGGGDGRQQDLERLVVGRDEHREPERVLLDRCGRRDGVDVPQRQREQQQRQDGVRLEQQQGDRDPPHVQVGGLQRAPGQVGERQQRGGDGDRLDPPAAQQALGVGNGRAGGAGGLQARAGGQAQAGVHGDDLDSTGADTGQGDPQVFGPVVTFCRCTYPWG